MKTKLSVLLFAASLGWMTACTDDLGNDGGNKPVGPTVESGKVLYGFSLKDFGKGSVPMTRADGDKLPASVPESKIDSLTVYVFNQNAEAPYDSLQTIFAEEFKVGDKLVADAANMTSSISLSGTGKKKIYFVANAIEQNELDQLKLGVSTEAQFLQMKTNLLSRADMLACPLIMTAVDSMEVHEKGWGGATSDYDVEIESAVAGRTINLKRIVARFDIENNAPKSDFIVESIALNNVRQAARVNKTLNFQATKHSEYAYATDATGTELPLIPTMEEFDFTRYPQANEGRAQSVFYVYPDMNGGTGVDAGDGLETDRFYLTLYGKTYKTGAKVVYNVYMYKDNADKTADPILIKPNNEYLIRINDLDPTRLNATITVQDWLIGDTVTYEMTDGTVALSCVEFPLTPAVDGQEGTGEVLTIPTDRALAAGVANVGAAANPVNVKVEAISEWELLKGYNAEWIDTLTNIDPTDLPVGTLTKVLPKQANPYNKDRRGTLVFRNVQRPSIMQTLIVVQEAGADANVRIGKLAAASADYTVYNRDDAGVNQVAETEKSDTLLLAAGDPFTNVAYTDIEVTVTGTEAANPEYYQEWGVRVDRIDTTWISVTKQPALNEKGTGITFSLAQNDSVQRKGVIRLYDRQDATIYRNLVIVQDGAEVTGTIVKAEERATDGFTDMADMDKDNLTASITFPKENCTGAEKQPYKLKLTTNGTWKINDVGDTEYRDWLDAYSLNKANERVMSGKGDAEIEIGTTANDSAIVRNGQVEILVGATLYTIDITKNASDPAIALDDIHVTDNHIDFAATGDVSQAIKFITNDRWTVTAVENNADGTASTTAADWLKFYNAKATNPDAEITAGSGSTLLRIAATEQDNSTGDAAPRSATVTITCEATAADGTHPTLVLTVYQAGLKQVVK